MWNERCAQRRSMELAALWHSTKVCVREIPVMTSYFKLITLWEECIALAFARASITRLFIQIGTKEGTKIFWNQIGTKISWISRERSLFSQQSIELAHLPFELSCLGSISDMIINCQIGASQGRVLYRTVHCPLDGH